MIILRASFAFARRVKSLKSPVGANATKLKAE
jgi:hypothetical protein